MERYEKYKDSGIEWIGEIPEGWEVKKLKYVLADKLKYGANESALLENRDDPRYIRITDFGEEKVALSEIIDVLNERFGTEFEEADRLFFEQIEAELMEDSTLKIQAKVNKLDTFKYAFEELFIDKLIERMDQNQDIFEKILWKTSHSVSW